MSDTDRGLHRHGPLNPSEWHEHRAFAGRKVKQPLPNTTMGERRAARTGKAAPKKAVPAEAVEEQQEAAQVAAGSLKPLGGGWYELPNGERIRGREDAEAALAALD